jgi:hypothetical protein
MAYIVESDFIIRAVDKPFHQRHVMGLFTSAEYAYQFIEKYLADTKELHTYFSRQLICSKEEYADYISSDRIVAFNIVLGQFEDMIYVRKADPST